MTATLPELETRRLLLRPLSIDDAPQVQERFPDWRIVQFLTRKVPWPYPEGGAESFIRNLVLPARSNGTAWHWSLRLKERPVDLVGMINLMTDENDNRGFWLCPELWGQGLMTEACEAVTDFWFEELGKKVLRVTKAVENIGSRRIPERSGMRVIWSGERDYISGRRPAELWEITRDEWRSRRQYLLGS